MSEQHKTLIPHIIVAMTVTILFFFWMIGAELKDAQRRIAVLEQRCK